MHSLWPEVLVAGRIDLAELIGAALAAQADPAAPWAPARQSAHARAVAAVYGFAAAFAHLCGELTRVWTLAVAVTAGRLLG